MTVEELIEHLNTRPKKASVTICYKRYFKCGAHSTFERTLERKNINSDQYGNITIDLSEIDS